MTTLKATIKLIDDRIQSLTRDAKIHKDDIPLIILKELLGGYKEDKSVHSIIEAINYNEALTPELITLLAAFFIHFPLASFALTNQQKKDAIQPVLIEAGNIKKSLEIYPKLLPEYKYQDLLKLGDKNLSLFQGCSQIVLRGSQDQKINYLWNLVKEISADKSIREFISYGNNTVLNYTVIKDLLESLNDANLKIFLKTIYEEYEGNIESFKHIMLLGLFSLYIKIKSGSPLPEDRMYFSGLYVNVEQYIAKNLANVIKDNLKNIYEVPIVHFFVLINFLENISPEIAKTIEKDILNLLSVLQNINHRHFEYTNLVKLMQYFLKNCDACNLVYTLLPQEEKPQPVYPNGTNATFFTPALARDTSIITIKKFTYFGESFVIALKDLWTTSQRQDARKAIKLLFNALLQKPQFFDYKACLATASTFECLNQEQQECIVSEAIRILSIPDTSTEGYANCLLVINTYAKVRTLNADHALKLYQTVAAFISDKTKYNAYDSLRFYKSESHYHSSGYQSDQNVLAAIAKHFPPTDAKTEWDKRMSYALGLERIDQAHKLFIPEFCDLMGSLFSKMPTENQEVEIQKIMTCIFDNSDSKADSQLNFFLLNSLFKNELAPNVKTIVFKKISEILKSSSVIVTERSDLASIFEKYVSFSIYRNLPSKECFDFILSNLVQIESLYCTTEDRISTLLFNLQNEQMGSIDILKRITKLMNLYDFMKPAQKIQFSGLLYQLYDKSSLNGFHEYDRGDNHYAAFMLNPSSHEKYSNFINQLLLLLNKLPSRKDLGRDDQLMTYEAKSSDLNSIKIICRENLIDLICKRIEKSREEKLQLSLRCDQRFLLMSMTETRCIPTSQVFTVLNLLSQTAPEFNTGNHSPLFYFLALISDTHKPEFLKNEKEKLASLLFHIDSAIKEKQVPNIDQCFDLIFQEILKNERLLSQLTYTRRASDYFIGLLKFTSKEYQEELLCRSVLAPIGQLVNSGESALVGRTMSFIDNVVSFKDLWLFIIRNLDFPIAQIKVAALVNSWEKISFNVKDPEVQFGMTALLQDLSDALYDRDCISRVLRTIQETQSRQALAVSEEEVLTTFPASVSNIIFSMM